MATPEATAGPASTDAEPLATGGADAQAVPASLGVGSPCTVCSAAWPYARRSHELIPSGLDNAICQPCTGGVVAGVRLVFPLIELAPLRNVLAAAFSEPGRPTLATWLSNGLAELKAMEEERQLQAVDGAQGGRGAARPSAGGLGPSSKYQALLRRARELQVENARLRGGVLAVDDLEARLADLREEADLPVAPTDPIRIVADGVAGRGTAEARHISWLPPLVGTASSATANAAEAVAAKAALPLELPRRCKSLAFRCYSLWSRLARPSVAILIRPAANPARRGLTCVRWSGVRAPRVTDG